MRQQCEHGITYGGHCSKCNPNLRHCASFKWGEYNPLVCCREPGHDGEHNYIVAGPAYSRVSSADGAVK